MFENKQSEQRSQKKQPEKFDNGRTRIQYERNEIQEEDEDSSDNQEQSEKKIISKKRSSTFYSGSMKQEDLVVSGTNSQHDQKVRSNQMVFQKIELTNQLNNIQQAPGKISLEYNDQGEWSAHDAPRDQKLDQVYRGAAQSELYIGQTITENQSQLIEIEKKDQKQISADRSKRGSNLVEEQFNKKQMEFKGGKLHQLITDQTLNSNKIYANRYQGLLGIWYFVIDTSIHFENFLAVVLFAATFYVEKFSEVNYFYALTALGVNIVLQGIRNCIFEVRQRQVTNKINNKIIDFLMITRTIKRFLPITWADVKPGQILRVKSGQEFPADCLILDIQGTSGQKCFVSCGAFDESTSIVQKKAYSATSNKTGRKQDEQNLAEQVSGFLKYEYNYFGFIQGSFKLNENPAAFEFDIENVVQRGALLTQTPFVICLVLNVGDQCIGSVYKDPKTSGETATNTKLRNMVKTQRSFDKAYKQSIRIFLLGLTVLYIVFAGLAVYLGQNDSLFTVRQFEQYFFVKKESDGIYYLKQGLSFFAILLSTIPLSFSNIIDLLVLTSTNFAEWDVNVQQANIEFNQPHATLAFGKVAHMFMSRAALQRDDKQFVKVFHVGGHFFLNKACQDLRKKLKDEANANSFSESSDSDLSDQEFEENDKLFDYLPNEAQEINLFENEETEMILTGPDNSNKKIFNEFFRAIAICHQVSAIKDQRDQNNIRYVGLFHDEIATLNFAKQQGFKLVQRSRKVMTLLLQGNQERYDELGVVTTKAIVGHFMTIGAVRLQGQQEGVLYMKGSIMSLKNYFIDRESDFQYLNLFEQKFIQAGVQSIVYAKRQLTIEETNKLIITINENAQSVTENKKLDSMLYNLTSVQLEILGVIGVSKVVHMRNRVVIDDMILNGVKPWIVSKEDEQSNLTSLNSMRLFQNCASALVVNGANERIVMDQIQNCLKAVIERMVQRNSNRDDINFFDDGATITNSDGQSKRSNSTYKKKTIGKIKQKLLQKEKDQQIAQNADSIVNSRNVVLFTGRALKEILRDQTMIKSFMTLAYLSDIMVGSEITPIQKQKLLNITKGYVGEGQYVSAIISASEDQFMVNEADLVANFKNRGKAADFQAVVDVSLKDFTAITYLLFKHGNMIQMRLTVAAQGFVYRSTITALILFTNMILSGFSGTIPFNQSFMYVFMLFISPLQLFIFSCFYKQAGHDYYYRIYGHYKYNFSYNLFEFDGIFMDTVCALFDWGVLYLPIEMTHTYSVTISDGKVMNQDGLRTYQILITQIIFFFYLINTNVQILYGISIILFLTFIGIAMIFDDEQLIGPKEFIMSPTMVLLFFWQINVLIIRNTFSDVFSKMIIPQYADLFTWYCTVEERLLFEEYENPNQAFSIQQFPPLYQRINEATIKNTLRLINTNMMKVPKTDNLEQILDKINIELDNDRRAGQQSLAFLNSEINLWTLQFNDLNKETEYQDNKNSREIIYILRQMVVLLLTTFLFAIFGFVLTLSDKLNIGLYYYLALYGLSQFVYLLLPRVLNYLSNILLIFTILVIFCYSIYTSQNESLQPTGLVFVLALVAGLNHSFIYPTILMVLISVLMHIFFSFMIVDYSQDKTPYLQNYTTIIWIIIAILWSVFIYIQELGKKTQFINGHRQVRGYLKLKSILNLLVSSMVRDSLKNQKKSLVESEGEISLVKIEIYQFEQIVQQYTGQELLNFLEQIYGTFDQLCEQFGLLKIESVGQNYVVSGGLPSAEKKIDTRLLNRHHTVRVTDFAMEVQNFAKTIILKNGKSLELRIAINTGIVISAVIGELKPQFILLGAVVEKLNKICAAVQQDKVAVSKETHFYLELYTNNYMFNALQLSLSDETTEQLFIVSHIKGRIHAQNKVVNENDKQKALKNYDGQIKGADSNSASGQPSKSSFSGENQNKNQDLIHASGSMGLINESDSNASNISGDRNRVNNFDENNENYEKFENESQKSDQVADESTNVFGFNDDLNLDDRQIIQNVTENQIYNLVERPKYLLSFEFKDNELDFLFTIAKQENFKTALHIFLLAFTNKIVVLTDSWMSGTFEFTWQFYTIFPFFVVEVILIWKILRPNIETIQFWTYCIVLKGALSSLIILSLQVKYINDWSVSIYIQLLFLITISLFFMIRSILLRYFILVYVIYFLVLIVFYIIYSDNDKVPFYKKIQEILSQVMYVLLLIVGMHHREMIQRKHLNYERILAVETDKTNVLISDIVPLHILSVIKSEKRQVDIFEDATLLYVDLSGFCSYVTQISLDPLEYVSILHKIYSRFDQVVQENKVYKVHLIGDLYVVMGYNGRLDKHKRLKSVVIDEINRILYTAFEMKEILQEIKDTIKSEYAQKLNLRISIHTGRIVAGLVGSKLVRYDLFGEGCIIAKKMHQKSAENIITISEDTRAILITSNDMVQEYLITEDQNIKIPDIERRIMTYKIEHRKEESMNEDQLSSEAGTLINGSSINSKSSKKSSKKEHSKGWNSKVKSKEVRSEPDEESDESEAKREKRRKLKI